MIAWLPSPWLRACYGRVPDLQQNRGDGIAFWCLRAMCAKLPGSQARDADGKGRKTRCVIDPERTKSQQVTYLLCIHLDDERQWPRAQKSGRRTGRRTTRTACT